MKLIGLTGGISTGKSTVCDLLRKKGAPIIDADVISREIVEPGQPALAEIALRFPGVVSADGAVLDRKALGERIFGNAGEREALNAIMHPRVREGVLGKTHMLADSGAPRAIYDAPLLIENGLHHGLDGVILVVAPHDIQRARLMARNQLTFEQAEARIASQMPLEKKRQFATWIIDNGGSVEATSAQVDSMWEKIVALP